MEYMNKEIAVIGLGKMGMGIALSAREHGWRVVGYDIGEEARTQFEKEGGEVASSIDDLLNTVTAPRVVWAMLPSGDISENLFLTGEGLFSKLSEGDTIIDAANAFYEDTTRRNTIAQEKGIHFIDVGYSGGPSGARNGGSIMVGGEKEHVNALAPLFDALSAKDAWIHTGPSGSGHFVKMVHNGIEYGMMQSLAEGFAVLKKAPFPLDLKNVAHVYNHSSVIESRLVGWLQSGIEKHGAELEEISGTVAHTGEGKWTVDTAKKLQVPTPSIELAYNFRVDSEKNPSYTGKILSMLRNQFGGHSAQ